MRSGRKFAATGRRRSQYGRGPAPGTKPEPSFAGYGNYQPELEKWLTDNDFFQNIWRKTSVFLDKVKLDWNIQLGSFDQRNPFIQDVAATLQHIFVKKILNKLEELVEMTGCRNLYFTGGSALNIVANSAIISSDIFKNVFIPPCTEDSGLALGAAAFMEWKKHGKIEIHSPYLNNWAIEDYTCKYSMETIKTISKNLVQKKIIGICNGFGEAGPRALGNRSIIALADSKTLSKKLSMEVKGREWYRPLAPIALEKNTKYFTGMEIIHPLSKYMLLDFKVLPDKQKEIAGAIHVDGTARFQTIFKRRENPFMFDLLLYLDENYNIKALINTSFNAKGKPIVHTNTDALNTAKKINLDSVVINGKYIESM